jgi:chorismate lyase
VNIADLDLDTRQFHWLSVNTLDIPSDYRYWIMLPGSLTRALRERTDQFSVKVIEQKDLQCLWPYTGQDIQINCFSRKVLLMNAEQPWVAAHTLIPYSSLENGLDELTRLKNKPLGELLFARTDTQKDHIQACQTSDGWGRRSRYILHGQPLLVSEFFLPGLIEHEYQRTASLY